MPDFRSKGFPRQLAAAYKELLDDIISPFVAAEDYSCTELPPRLSEHEVQCMWQAGLLGHEGDTTAHGHVRVLDFGEWNRCAGPDFLRAELEIDGKRVRGDVEIDPGAQDWERHGHGANPLYNRVALHVVLSPPPPGWFTRNSLHLEVPVMYLPPSRLRRALGLSAPPDREVTPFCRQPLSEMSAAHIESLLCAAAAFRAENKRRRFHSKADALGEEQAWFEAWAETLGYSANKSAMLTLARRAPLSTLKDEPEAILFGTAGFLVPMLPDKATDEARLYHRHVWDSWWVLKDRFSLSDSREIAWAMTGQRPLNHPHRRVAALAACAADWPHIRGLFTAAGARRLAAYLEALRHPFWDFHCTINSAPLLKRSALVGRERIVDFLVNYVYVLDESPGAWETYLSARVHSAPGKVERVARHLFGRREELDALLRYSYAQQGLLQIATDFCNSSPCAECLFPAQLRQWER